MTNGLEILAQAVVTGNLILVHGLGLFVLTRYTKNVREAASAGLTVAVGMLVGAILLWLCGSIIPAAPVPQVGFYLLVALAASCLTSALLKQDVTIERRSVDSAIVGLLLLMGRSGVTGVHNVWMALAAGVGYLLVLVVMATIRRRLELAPVPRPLQGLPILLITAGLLAMALLGFRL